jgi:hypothetical protein
MSLRFGIEIRQGTASAVPDSGLLLLGLQPLRKSVQSILIRSGRPSMIPRRDNESSPNRILIDVTNVIREIGLVANAMIAEATLPNWKAHVLFESEPAGGTALDILHYTLKRFVGSRSQEHVKMIRHQNESM